MVKQVETTNGASPIPTVTNLNAATPITNKNGQMDFPEAIRQLIKERRVTRLDWEDKNCYLFLSEHLMIHKPDGSSHQLIISDGDMLGTDWVIV